jgi:hypothetical protein
MLAGNGDGGKVRAGNGDGGRVRHMPGFGCGGMHLPASAQTARSTCRPDVPPPVGSFLTNFSAGGLF